MDYVDESDRLPTDPSAVEIERAAAQIRELGFTTERGESFPPWSKRIERDRRKAVAGIVRAPLTLDTFDELEVLGVKVGGWCRSSHREDFTKDR